MFSRKKELLKGNVPLLPFIIFINAFGFHLEKGKSKIFGLIHSVSLLIAILASGFFIYMNIDYTRDKIISSIYCINCSCIYITTIMVSFHNIFMKNRKNFWDVIEHLHHIDILLKAFHYTNDSKSHSGFSVQILILVLFISISPLLLILNFLNKNFNMGQCVYLMLVLIISVEIIIYTMLVGNIKARFILLKAYLGDKKSESLVIDTRGLFSSPILPCFREISMIYDEMLEVISVLNESFSVLLSFTLSKYLDVISNIFTNQILRKLNLMF